MNANDEINSASETSEFAEAGDPGVAESSTFLSLVNDPGIVVYRRSLTSQAPLRWVSHNVFNVLGYRSEALLRSNFGFSVDAWAALVHRDSTTRYRKFIHDLLDIDKAGCLYQVLAADGGYRFIREEARLVRNYDEQAVDIVGCLIDWTSLTPIQSVIDASDSDEEESYSRQFRMRELELIADLLAAHSHIRQQARGYRDVVQTLTHITERLKQSASNGTPAGLVTDQAASFKSGYDVEALPIGIYRSQPSASRQLTQANTELARLISLDQYGVDQSNPVGFELSKITTPDVARTNEETVDLAIQSREDFDLVYPVMERSAAEVATTAQDSVGRGRGIVESDPRWLRWIWEQGRVEYDENDKPVAINGVIADVTESMATETHRGNSTLQSEIPFLGERSRSDSPSATDSSEWIDLDSIYSAAEQSASGAGSEHDPDNSYTEFETALGVEEILNGPMREPLTDDDEVVAVFNSSNMFSVESPTVELETDTVGEEVPEVARESSLPLSVSGAEIASWDVAPEPGSDPEASAGEDWEFDYLLDDAPYEIGGGDTSVSAQSISADAPARSQQSDATKPDERDSEDSAPGKKFAPKPEKKSKSKSNSGRQNPGPAEAAEQPETASVPSTARVVSTTEPVRSTQPVSTAAMLIKADSGGVDEVDKPKEKDAAAALAEPPALGENSFKHLRLYAQPAYHVKSTDRASYVEVLLRMQHDDKLLRPDQFKLHQATQALALEVDYWVMENSIASLNNATSGSDETGVSINLSAHAVTDTKFDQHLRKCIERSAVAPSRIAFEVQSVEGAEQGEALRHFIDRVRKSGCSVTLDNFGGTGVTLHELAALPVDRIKIDGALVQGLVENDVDQAIIKAICEVAEQKGISVAAQHVEDRATVVTLTELGVEIVQGNGLAPAIPLQQQQKH